MDQAIRHAPLDALSITIYVVFFLLVAYASNKRPAYGLGALIATQPFAYYHDVGTTTITLPKIALAAVVLSLFVRHYLPRVSFDKDTRGLALAIVLVIAATALSIAHAAHTGPAVRETLKWCEYLVLFFAAYVAFWHDPDIGFISRVIAVTVCAVTLVAASQELFGAPSGLWYNGHPIPRLTGPLEGPNQLAAYLEICLPVLLALLLAKFDRWMLAALALASFADVSTFSRAGVICALLAILVVVLMYPRSPQLRAALLSMFAGAAAAGGVAAFWGWTAHASNLAGGSSGIFRTSTLEVNYAGSVGKRSQLWHAAFTLWHQHPVFGVGAGNFELELADAGLRGVRTHANSWYFQAMVEQGIPGLLAALWLAYESLALFWARRAAGGALAAGALGAGLALALHQSVDLLTFFPKVAGMWLIVMAMACAEAARKARTNPEPQR